MEEQKILLAFRWLLSTDNASPDHIAAIEREWGPIRGARGYLTLLTILAPIIIIASLVGVTDHWYLSGTVGMVVAGYWVYLLVRATGKL